MPRPVVAPEIRGWILFDQNCGICRTLAARWKLTLNRKGFEVEMLQAPWVSEEFKLPTEEVSKDFRLLFIDGTNLKGADVYRYLMRQFWWGYPFYWVSVLPVLRQIFDRCYETFRDSRSRFSKSCGLK